MPAPVETDAISPNIGILLSVLPAETVNSMDPVVYKWFMGLNVETFPILQLAKMYADWNPALFRREIVETW